MDIRKSITLTFIDMEKNILGDIKIKNLRKVREIFRKLELVKPDINEGDVNLKETFGGKIPRAKIVLKWKL